MKCPICNSENYKHKYTFVWGEVSQCLSCKCAYCDISDVEAMNKESFTHTKDDEDIQTYRLWARDRLDTLQRHVNSGRLLELGYRTGEFLYTAAQAGFHCVGVDLFSNFRQENNHPMISLVKTDAKHFRSEAPFDAVVALHLLEHFREPYQFLRNVKENLKDTGFFLIEIPNYASLSRIISGKRWRCFTPYHAFHMQPKSLSMLLDRAGFEIIDLKTVSCSSSQLAKLTISFFLRRLRLKASFGEPKGSLWRLAANFEKKLLWGLNLRAIARKTKKSNAAIRA